MADKGDRLDGWKAISDHLGKDERTVQRWRRQRGMPVHRVPGGKSGAVFAFRPELDAWLTYAPANGNGGAATQAPGNTGAKTSEDSEPATRAAVISARIGRYRYATALIGVLAIAAAGGVAVTVKTSAGPIHRLDFIDGQIVALDAEDRHVWTYAPPVGVDHDAKLARSYPADLDADGAPDRLAIVDRTGNSDATYAFNEQGKLLWSFVPDLTYAFHGRSYGPPWHVMTISPPPSTGKGPLLVSLIHHTWWPSVVFGFDRSGRHEVRFVNAGYVEVMARLPTASAGYALMGGVNNEYGSAYLAVVNEYGPAVTSPQTPNSQFDCDNCPTGRPLKYFVFPRSELNAMLHQPYNFAFEIVSNSDGSFDVSVREGRREAPGIRSIYRFSPGLIPISVARSDGYWATHRQLESEGRVSHTAAECQDRTTAIVRVWEPGKEWTDLQVPYDATN